MTVSFEQISSHLAPRYELQRELGRGGMATVFLARDTRYDRSVAIKVLDPAVGSAIGPIRFEREIHLVARLSHPHILPIFDSGEAEGTLWFAMPYVEGETLRDRMDRDGQLPLAEALRLASQVAAALDYAHRHKVVHRDVKPENILILDDQALIADFGVARALDSAEGRSVTGTGVVVGTPAYMSPEQAAADQAVDGRADVYALGCVLYEMLAGEPPFTGATPQAVIAKRFALPTPSVRVVRPEVPTAIDQALARATARAPADRYASAGEFAAALRTDAPAAKARGMPKRLRTALLAAGVVLVAVGAWLAARRPSDAAPLADNRRLLVAPFANETGDTTLTPLGRIAADWITRALIESDLVDVVDPGRTLDTAALADRAARVGAGLAITGAIYRRGDELLFDARLVEPATGTVVSTVTPVRSDTADPVSGADSLRAQVLGTLARHVDRRLAMLGAGARPPAYDAYRAFMLGQQLYWSGRFPEAAARFAEAHRSDPRFHLAAIRLGVTHLSTRNCAGVDSIAASLSDALLEMSAAERAQLERLTALCRGDLASALANARAFAQAEPGSSYAKFLVAQAALAVNRFDESVRVSGEIDPERDLGWMPTAGKAQYWFDRTWALHLLGRYDDELAAAEQAREMDGDAMLPLLVAARALVAAGKPAAAVAHLRDALGRELGAEARVMGSRLAPTLSELRRHGAGSAADELTGDILARMTEGRDRAVSDWRSERAQILLQAGRYDEAAAAMSSDRIAPPERLGFRGLVAAFRGDSTGARATIDSLERDGQAQGARSYLQARIAGALGDSARATELLRSAQNTGEPVAIRAHADPAFSRVWHTDWFARFEAATD